MRDSSHPKIPQTPVFGKLLCVLRHFLALCVLRQLAFSRSVFEKQNAHRRKIVEAVALLFRHLGCSVKRLPAKWLRLVLKEWKSLLVRLFSKRKYHGTKERKGKKCRSKWKKFKKLATKQSAKRVLNKNFKLRKTWKKNGVGKHEKKRVFFTRKHRILEIHTPENSFLTSG